MKSVLEKALYLEDAKSRSKGMAGDPESTGQRHFSQLRPRRNLTSQQVLAQRIGHLLGCAHLIEF